MRVLASRLGSNEGECRGRRQGAEVSDGIQEVAKRANVPEDFVRALVAAGALPGEESELELAGAVRRVRLLRSWTAAGLSVETILTWSAS